MRAMVLTVPALLVWTAAALAQGVPPIQPAAPPVDRRLNDVLEGWEKSMGGLTSFKAFCNRTNLDKAIGASDVLEGTALFVKGKGDKQPSRASLELVNKKKPAIFEKYICTGKFLYEYAPADKIIRVHDLPTPKPGQVGDENFLQFLFGMKANEALKRYDMEYVAAPPETAKYYHYIRIRAKEAHDKVDFSEAQLTLMANTFLPRRLWYHQPNGNEITWDFLKVEPNATIPLTNFDPPQNLPQGWRMERAQQARIAPGTAPTPKFRPQDR